MSGTASAVKYRAPAKVNVSLEVVGRRPDGYHEIVSVMQTVSLSDEIEIIDGSEILFTCSEPGLGGNDNLVPRAARLLQSASRSTEGAQMRLVKSIPHGAGLGGGSSDAATVLRVLNDRWDLGLSLAQLVGLGARLGSDVPFFLHGGSALVTGRGEFVDPLPTSKPVWYALIKPPISVPTSTVFNALLPSDWTDGMVTRDIACGMSKGASVQLGVNGLQHTLFTIFPATRECFEEVSQAAPGRAFISGSGPTIAVLCGTRNEAKQVISAVANEDRWCAIVQSTGRNDA